MRRLPKLGKESEGKCEPFQLGKQLKMSHKGISNTNTTKVLELLHMDLMGPVDDVFRQRRNTNLQEGMKFNA